MDDVDRRQPIRPVNLQKRRWQPNNKRRQLHRLGVEERIRWNYHGRLYDRPLQRIADHEIAEEVQLQDAAGPNRPGEGKGQETGKNRNINTINETQWERNKK